MSAISSCGAPVLQLGTAKLCITPCIPVRLCGYASRSRCFDSVDEDIFARVAYFARGKARLCLFSADLIWWNSEFVERMRPALARALGIPAEAVLLTATHNHSGPGTGNTHTPLLESADAGYTELLAQRLLQAAREAADDLQPVSAKRFNGTCAMNVYRRVQTEAGVQMQPNYAVPADHTLTALGFYRADGSLKSAIFHYPCHANLSDGNTVQPDYPGIAMRLLEAENPGCTSLFLQGCTGDLRPNSVLGARFIPCDYPRVQRFAADFAACCAALLKTKGNPLDGALAVYGMQLRLPLVQRFTLADVREMQGSPDEAHRQWACRVLEKELRPYETLALTRVQLAGVPLYFFGAEVVQSYAEFARGLAPGALCAGYTNGMIGYLADAAQIAAGGYEPEGSALYFALAGTYPPAIEALIQGALRTLDAQAQSCLQA